MKHPHARIAALDVGIVPIARSALTVSLRGSPTELSVNVSIPLPSKDLNAIVQKDIIYPIVKTLSLV
jgi:hypothetical protein